MTKKAIENLLAKNNCTVTFIKRNGEVRKGLFKLNEDAIYNTDAIGVIECTTGNYRAFKASSVLSINGVMV